MWSSAVVSEELTVAVEPSTADPRRILDAVLSPHGLVAIDAPGGIVMPGTVLLGSRYYQEVAPGVAEDQAENAAMDVTVETPASTFTDCLQVDETTPLEPGVSAKLHARDIGLVQDGAVPLVESIEP